MTESEKPKASCDTDVPAIEREMTRLRRFSEFMMQGPFMEDMFGGGKDAHIFCMEFPRILDRMLRRTLESKKSLSRRGEPAEDNDLLDDARSRTAKKPMPRRLIPRQQENRERE
jgi:hypothetical protein